LNKKYFYCFSGNKGVKIFMIFFHPKERIRVQSPLTLHNCLIFRFLFRFKQRLFFLFSFWNLKVSAISSGSKGVFTITINKVYFHCIYCKCDPKSVAYIPMSPKILVKEEGRWQRVVRILRFLKTSCPQIGLCCKDCGIPIAGLKVQTFVSNRNSIPFTGSFSLNFNPGVNG